MLTIGIDPGVTGAVVVAELFGQQGNILYELRLPVLESGGGSRKVDFEAVSIDATLQRYASFAELIMVERMNPRPGQGVVSTGKIMECGGVLYGLMLAWAGPDHVRLADPATWKGRMGLTKQKARSLRLAAERFPSNAHLFRRVTVDDGVAEAALLCYYGHLYRDRL